ncbi:MAG: flippase-like domain-containing protein [Deltaproteobacteria bacterium]|nr:flippase-like domain-containing protein [Deltaproteobacteria bacterium]
MIEPPPTDPAETAASNITSKRSSPRAWYVFTIKMAAGAALLALLVWHFNLRATFREIEHERPLFFASTVALYAGAQLVSSFRWQLLARLNRIVGDYREFATYYFIGMFTNVFVPGLIGGDSLRAFYLGRRHNRMAEAVASVVADRGIGLLTLFGFAAVAALLIKAIHLPPVMLRVTLAAGAASLLAYAAGPAAAKLVERIPGRAGLLLASVLPYMRQPLALVPAVLLSAVVQFFLAVCQYLLGLGLGLGVPLTTFVLVVPMANVITSLPLTINGLGMREAAYLVLLGLAGVSHANAVALSLLYFAATLTAGLTGIVPFMLTPVPTPADEVELPHWKLEPAAEGSFEA